MNARTRIPALALTAALSLTLTLTACSNDTPAPVVSATPAAVATATPGAAEPAPVEPTAEVTEAPAEPVADEYSQVIDGVLYAGTASAPVRIGDDTPGQAPAAEGGFARDDGWKDYAQSADKYVVSIFASDGGWTWKAFGLSRYGSFRELANSGYPTGRYLPSRDAAVADTKLVDGRELDRSEYILVLN